ncbi:MAG: hypothetical protein U0573_03905 [Phycisphaerales bacterium]|nr:hypothetical protein [Planctomycetota bacterium]
MRAPNTIRPIFPRPRYAAVFGAAAIAIAAPLVRADTTVTLWASVQGLFTSYGQNNKNFNTGPGNYLCGYMGNGSAMRNYFVFNLTPGMIPAGQQVKSATFEIGTVFNHYQSLDPSETYALFHVNDSSYFDLLDVNTSIWLHYSTYNDLGDGIIYGSRELTPNAEPFQGIRYLPMTLDPAKVTNEMKLRLASGANNFAVGGHLTTISSGNYRQACFGFSGSDPSWGGPPKLTLIIGVPCPADLNGDSMVDDADFVQFASAYNLLDCADPAMPSNCPSDLNKDGVVDDSDFVIFAAAYNALLCP